MAGTQQSLRKALGALKDSTTVGLAKVNSEYKELDVAIVKATNHLEVLSKEKHIRTIFNAVASSRPRTDVCYCINTLAKRLAKTHNWAVALKSLIVIHRALREVGPTFREELLNYSRGSGLMLNLSHFKDDSSPNAWDYSAWVRSYALYLEERLECFRILKYDVETDRSRLRQLDTPHLLAQLPALQQLLFRLLACQPDGAAGYNILIQYALSMIAAESLLFYVAITDGTLNLVDKYFEMQRHDAVRALEIYRKSGNQAERLSQFLEICRGLDFGRSEKFIKIEQPPASFLEAMEEYVKEAPRTIMIEWNEGIGDSNTTPVEVPEPVAVLEIDNKQVVDVEEKMDSPVTLPEPPKNEQNEPAETEQVADLLGLDYLDQDASKLDDKNSLALAIFTSETPSNLANDLNLTSETNGWEVALVASTSSNVAVVGESKLGGGLDKLTLDSLYDDAIARRTNPYGTTYHQQAASNPFETTPCSQDPFYASSNITPPTNVQMASMNQQQALMMQQQQQQLSNNPFGNPGETVQQSYPNHVTYPGLI